LGEVRRQRRAPDERDVDAAVPETANLIRVGDVVRDQSIHLVDRADPRQGDVPDPL
jgi:hypothetical protein